MLMRAEEARMRSQSGIDGRSQKGLDAAEDAIRRAVLNGDFSCWCYEFLTPKAVDRLMGLGYKIENRSNQRDGTMFLISWS